MTTLKTLVGRRWWWVTLLAIAGVLVLIRLGFWQLDRLELRRAYNHLVWSRWTQEPYDLAAQALPDDLSDLEFRRVQIQGEYDYERQIVLKNQDRSDAPGAPGVNLITPLKMADGRTILVARGWVPYDQGTPELWSQYDEPGDVPIIGLIQQSQMLPYGDPVPIPSEAQIEWFYLNIDAVQAQFPDELMPVFVLQLPDDERPYDALPFREEPIRLDEGSHLSYAIQWFMFALILGFGYIQYVRFQELRDARILAAQNDGEGEDGQLPDESGGVDIVDDLPSIEPEVSDPDSLENRSVVHET